MSSVLAEAFTAWEERHQEDPKRPHTSIMGSIAVDGADCPVDIQRVHVVLLGDSTLDNARYLNLAFGELSVEKQLARRCAEKNWLLTVLAQDGSLLEDVLQRQLPKVPENATHVVISASGNDLLALLNQMVVAKFTLGSMYSAIGEGLKQVSQRYRGLIHNLRSLGCHLACCTVYRPNFNHVFFKSLATFSLGLHNSRLMQIAQDFDCSVIDLANMLEGQEDFANPLELSTRGGSKVVENIAQFVADTPVFNLRKYRHRGLVFHTEDDTYVPSPNPFAVRCCATRAPSRKIYASKVVSKVGQAAPGRGLPGPGALQRSDLVLSGPVLSRPLDFSEAQECWRQT